MKKIKKILLTLLLTGLLSCSAYAMEGKPKEVEKHQQSLNEKIDIESTLQRFRKSELINVLSDPVLTRCLVKNLFFITKNKLSDETKYLRHMIYTYMYVCFLYNEIKDNANEGESEEDFKDILIEKLKSDEHCVEAIKMSLDRTDLSKIKEKLIKNKSENVVEEIKKLIAEEIQEKYGKYGEKKPVENEKEELEENQELEKNIQIFEGYFQFFEGYFSNEEEDNKEKDQKNKENKKNEIYEKLIAKSLDIMKLKLQGAKDKTTENIEEEPEIEKEMEEEIEKEMEEELEKEIKKNNGECTIF